MWHAGPWFPEQGLNLCPLHWERGVLTTGPPGKLPYHTLKPSGHPILRCPLLLLPPIPPSIRVFSNESTLRRRWPKYWARGSASWLSSHGRVKLKFRYFGHLMRRIDSLEKTLMLGGIGGRRRRGQRRMRWLNGITDSMDVSLSVYQQFVNQAAVPTYPGAPNVRQMKLESHFVGVSDMAQIGELVVRSSEAVMAIV